MFPLVWPSLSEGPSTTPTPPPFSPFEVAWTDAYWADDPDWTNPGDGNAVSTWRSGGSGGRAATGSGSVQPLFRSSVANLNNRAAIEFDGSDDSLQTSSYALDHPSTSVLICHNLRASQANRQDLCPGVGIRGSADGSAWYQDGSALVSSGVDATSTRTVAIRSRVSAASGSNTMTIVVNGSSTGPGGSSAARWGLSGIQLGNGNWTSNSQIAFYGYYSGDATVDAKWSQLVSWVSSYYGLTLG